MLFSKLKISTKIIISSAVFLIPIGILLFLYCSSAFTTIEKSEKGRNAIDPLKQAVKVMKIIPHYINVYLDLDVYSELKPGDLGQLEDQKRELEDQKRELENQTKELSVQIEELNVQIEELYDQTDELYDQTDELNVQIWELYDQSWELYDQINEVYVQIWELDIQISKVSRDIKVLEGLEQLLRDLVQLDDQISEALNVIDTELPRYKSEGEELPNLLTKWKDLKEIDRTDKKLPQEFSDFINSLRKTIDWIGERSELILVSDINTYYFVVSAFSHIPDAVMRTIDIGNVVRRNLHEMVSFIERVNREIPDQWDEGLEEHGEEWPVIWLDEWLVAWLEERWGEELLEEWGGEEVLEERGEEWWTQVLWESWLLGKWLDEWFEEYGEEWMEERVIKAGQRDILLEYLNYEEYSQIFGNLAFLYADKDRIKTSLESAMEEEIPAMEEDNGRADNFGELITRLRRYVENIPGSVMGEENRNTDDFQELTTRLEQYEKTFDNMEGWYFHVFSNYYWMDDDTIIVDFLEVLSLLNKDLCELWDVVLTNINTLLQSNVTDARRDLRIYLGIALVSLGIAFSFLVFITLDISRSVKSLKILFKGLNENDLTMSLRINSKDEFGELMTAFNGFLNILRSTVGSFKQSSQLVANSVFDLASSTKEITTTANEQSAGVSEIVSTMEGSKNLSEQIALKTTEVANLANETQDLSSKGAELREANQAMMEEIRNQNQKIISEIRNVSDMIIRISEAIRIIDGIADQTKLIAFNASLEASSSGEAGARFSVVASEIRRFADNVVESTREIKQKIEEVQGASQSLIAEANSGSRQIETGYERMSEQKIVFEQIVDVSQNVATRSQQISNLSKQQELASSQIFTALKEISAGVKQFVAATSSTSKIADSLNGMSEELKEKVEKYRTET